jgi:hypothetical protein
LDSGDDSDRRNPGADVRQPADGDRILLMRHDATQTREQRIAWDILRNSATGRTAAAMGGRLWPLQLVGTMSRRERAREDAVESDRRYFRRRADEERQAARRAAGVKAREAHSKLAQLYAELARSPDAPLDATRHWSLPRRAPSAGRMTFTNKRRAGPTAGGQAAHEL